MNDDINKDARPALESLLSRLNRDQLQSLLLKLAEQEPSVIATIERQATLLQTSSSQPTTPSSVADPKPSIAVDTKAIRHQVRASIRSLDRMRASEAYWYVGAVVSEIGQLVEQAWTLIKADDAQQIADLLVFGLHGTRTEIKVTGDLARCDMWRLRGIVKKVHNPHRMNDSTGPGSSFALAQGRWAFPAKGCR